MKVAEGQLENLQRAADLLRSDKSMPSDLIREYVEGMVKDQAVAPDVVPSTVKIHPEISPETGKLITFTT